MKRNVFYFPLLIFLFALMSGGCGGTSSLSNNTDGVGGKLTYTTSTALSEKKLN